MAEAAAEEPLTTVDMMEHWQFMKAVVQFKDGTMEYDEAIDHMSFYMGLDVLLCEMMLKELVKEKRDHLMAAFPSLTALPDPWANYRRRKGPGASLESSPPVDEP